MGYGLDGYILSHGCEGGLRGVAFYHFTIWSQNTSRKCFQIQGVWECMQRVSYENKESETIIKQNKSDEKKEKP
jgi:hypothetical protein